MFKKKAKKTSYQKKMEKFLKAGIDDITIFDDEDLEDLPDVSDDDAIDFLISKASDKKDK